MPTSMLIALTEVFSFRRARIWSSRSSRSARRRSRAVTGPVVTTKNSRVEFRNVFGRFRDGVSHFKQEPDLRSEEHTSELQSLMRISSAVFCLKTQTLQSLITIT